MSGMCECNFDGLAGPTHYYGGLARGNLAAMASRGQVSNPRAAALQGLAKMRVLLALGVPQGVLPPHERPCLAALRRHGFTGSDASVLDRAWRQAPDLLLACSSAAAMWAANAATFSPAADCADGRSHFTPANLATHAHRALEAPFTAAVLRRLFPPSGFAHHLPLAGAGEFDEGAANQLRLAPTAAGPGLEVFVYGRTVADLPGRFPARQTREASAAIARAHGLTPARTLLVRQHPAAIAAGAFHNDVICVAHEGFLLAHEAAFADGAAFAAALRHAWAQFGAARPLRLVVVPAARLPLADAVACYLFNSQIVSRAAGGLVLVAPAECATQPAARALLDELAAAPDGPVRELRYVDLRQSMANGGGPACLRLRVQLTATERAAVHPGVWLTPTLADRLADWVRRRYRTELRAADLADPQLLAEGRAALDELTVILGLGCLYDFQRDGAP